MCLTSDKVNNLYKLVQTYNDGAKKMYIYMYICK